MSEKEKRKIPRPTTRRYNVYCEGCNASDEHFMTGVEFYNKTIIKQWCSVCDKFTNWALPSLVLIGSEKGDGE